MSDSGPARLTQTGGSLNIRSCLKQRHSKVRTGCDTCKRRKIKCDEIEPACHRCTRANLQCEGYNPPAAWIFEPEKEESERSILPEACEKVRQIRPHQKSRTGCSQCRAKKTKCDETRPHCLKCLSRGQTCPGYPRRTRLFHSPAEEVHDAPYPEVATSESDSFPAIVDPKQAPAQNLNRLKPVRAQPGQNGSGTLRDLPIWDITSAESQALQFFHEETKPALRAFNTSADSFFLGLVPQMSLYEGSIRYLLIAIGSAHRMKLRKSCCDELASTTSLEHYGKALRYSFRHNYSAAPHLILTACLLFVEIEMLHENLSLAFSHLRSGLRVLRHYRLTTSRLDLQSREVITTSIEPIFAKLAATASLTGRSGVDPVSDLSWCKPAVPDTLPSFRRAQEKFYEIAEWVNYISTSAADSPTDGPHLLELWHKRLQDLLLRLHNEDSSICQQARLLDIQYRAYRLTAKCQSADDEIVWDEPR